MSITPPAPENPLGQPSGGAPPPPPPPPGYEQPAASVAQGRYAGWWQRVGAAILDGLIVGIPLYAILGILIAGGAADDEIVTESEFNPIWSILSFVVPYLYYGLTMGRKGTRNGQTLGKQIVGYRVVREDRAEIGFWWAVGRQLVSGVLGAITLLVNFLWPLWDKKNQALHDKVMHDLVVRT